MAIKTYHGSCVCKKIQYEADIDFAAGTMKCNCTYCTKGRLWKVFLKPEALRVTAGQDAATMYKRHPAGSDKFFCATCGIYTHEFGDAPWMGGPYAGVFVGSLDDATVDELMSGPINYADGLHDNWMQKPEDVRHL